MFRYRVVKEEDEEEEEGRLDVESNDRRAKLRRCSTNGRRGRRRSKFGHGVVVPRRGLINIVIKPRP